MDSRIARGEGVPSGSVLSALVSDDLKTLTLTLYSTIANIDRLRYTEDSESPLIGMVRWIQTSAETVEVRCQLKERLWGYDVRYENGRLICEVYAPPKTTWMRPLSGLTVAVDPGHSPNLGDGTIGPQGVKEGDANFQIAAVLKDRLERSGAKVFMTRRQDEAVPLPERGRRAAQAKADLFVSVHTNALPDGANPFDRGGYSVFYFQPQSYAFAREVHAAYKESVALADDGFYYGNLAVCRTTQMPSILTESGYLILPQEEELLLDPVFQRRIADSIVHGLSVFMRSVAKD
jgi:N-acetylmuramoyl-L-alanine amidase